MSVYKVRMMLSVIPRLDRGIQCFRGLLDYPVKPDNDKIRLYTQTLISQERPLTYLCLTDSPANQYHKYIEIIGDYWYKYVCW